MKRYLTAAVAAMLVATGWAQQAEQVTIGDNFNYGITYSLPTTALQLTVTAQCTVTVAGQYAIYAEKLLGLHDAPLADQTLWQVQSIRLEPVAQADTSRTYHLVFSEKGALPTFYFTPEHSLWAINRKPEEPQADVPAAAPQPQAVSYRPSDVLTPDILKAGSKSKQAELIAQEIFSIRESRSELIRGEADNVPNDGKQLQLMLDNLTAQEAALMSYFVGTTTVSQHTFVRNYLPTDAVERDVAFRFSSELGMVEADNLAGAPYYISIQPTEDNRLPEMDPKARKKLEKGVAFCVPGKARVRIFTAEAALAEGDVDMAQFGHVEQLPQAQFTDRKRPCSALFAPATGAVRFFETTTE